MITLNEKQITQKARILSELINRTVTQRMNTTLGTAKSFSTIIGREAWMNGTKELLTQGLFEIENYNIDEAKTFSIDQLNPSENKIFSQVYWIEHLKKLRYQILDSELYNAFTSDATKVQYVENKVRQTMLTWEKFYQDLEARLIFGLQTIEKIAENGTKTNEIIEVDQTISNTIASTTKDVVNMSETEMLKSLEGIRNKIDELSVLSAKHTKFASDSSASANTKYGIDSATRKKFVYSATRGDLIIVWNSKFRQRLNTISAKLFHNNDLITNGPSMSLNMEKFDFYDSLSSTQKSAIKKTICYIIDKRSLKKGFEVDNKVSSMRTFDKTVYRRISFFGYARDITKPIYKVVVA